MRKLIYAYLIPLIIIVLSALVVSGIVVGIPVQTDVTPMNQRPVIILDAGHGGIDGGASSKDGTVEKNINLDITLTLRDMLQMHGYEVVLTRDTDISIHDSDATTIKQIKVSDIHNRLKIMESYPNCIFVSIHQNFYTESKYNGAQFFYSPNHPSSKVLADSFRLAFTSQLQPENQREIKPAGKEIYLMWHAKVPAVLAECGFLSNPEEASLLTTQEYRNKLAFNLMNGIFSYLDKIYGGT